MRRPSRDRVGWRFLWHALVVLILVAASMSALAVAGAAQDSTDEELGCASGDDGVLFRTDGGLEVTHDGRSLREDPFVNDTTLSFPNATVRATDNASLTVASATERRVCLTDADPIDASLVVVPAGGPTMVVADAFDSLTYGSVDYARSETGADLAYSTPTTARIDVVDVPLEPGQTVQVVDAQSRTVLDTGRVTEAQTLELRLPGGANSVDLRLAPVATETQTVDPTEDGADSDGFGTGTGAIADSTTERTPNASHGRSAGWTTELVDYQPSPQTQHVGGFLPVTILLWLMAIWLFLVRHSREATWLALVLVAASLRATSDLLQVLLDGFVGVQTSIATINLLLELSLALLFVQFAAVYVNEPRFRTRRAKLGLGAVAVLGTVSVLTNPIHGLVFADAEVASGPFTYVTTTAGPGGWLLFALNTSLLVAGGGLIIRSLLSPPLRFVWRPVAVIGTGLCLAVVLGLISMFDRGPVSGYDYTASGVNYFVLLTAVTLTMYGLQRLKQSGQKSVIADIEDPIVVLDDAWTVVECNAAARRLLPDVDAGRHFDAILAEPLERPTVGGTTTRKLRLMVDASVTDPTREPATATDGGNVESPGPRPESRGPSSDRERYFIVKATTVTTETNAVIGYTVQFDDVTHLEQRTRALEARNDQLDQFASAITQDLQTPLTEAERYTEQAVELFESAEGLHTVDRSRLSTYLQQIGDALDQIADVIEDTLGLARGADLDTDPQSVEFGRIVESTWEMIGSPEATLYVESSGEITADADHLERLLEQLFRNALEHGSASDRTPSDNALSADITIRVGLDETGFYVADDGPGVSEAVRNELFEPGVTSKDNGSGLGLAIAEQRASAHGWEIALDPDRERTRFVVTGCETAPDSGTSPEGAE